MDIWNDLTDAIGKEMAISEMSKKYLNTYLTLIKPDGKPIIVLYTGYENDGHWFTDPLNTKIKLKHDTTYRLVCEFPERRLFNHKGQALEFVRRPNRQNKRGICKDNAMIYSPVRKLFGGDNHNWTIHTITDALYPEYPSFEEAIKLLSANQAISVAISPKFAITHSITKHSYYYLFYSNILIGYMNADTIHIKHSLFKQEVLDNINLFKSYKVDFNA